MRPMKFNAESNHKKLEIKAIATAFVFHNSVLTTVGVRSLTVRSYIRLMFNCS